jgi:hypothetical protein
MRYRITVRGDKSELRGYITTPTEEGLRIAAESVTPIGLMVASQAPDDYNPFAISEPEHPPTLEASTGIMESLIDLADGDNHALLEELSRIHYAQALVIRGERALREQAERALATEIAEHATTLHHGQALEKEMRSRELHHFETEQENGRLEADNARLFAVLERVRAARSNHPECDVHKNDDPVTCGWKRAVQDIDKVLVS